MPNKPSHGEGGTGGGQRPGGTHLTGATGIRSRKPMPNWGAQEVLNPPFDPRMRRIGSPLVNPKPMKRGWIQTAKLSGASDNWRVNFLFNPSEISLNHAISQDVPSPEQVMKNPNVVPGMSAALANVGASLSFSLLFDRTYEVWTQRNNTLANTFGVYADVGAFYKYLHVLAETPRIDSPQHISKPGDPELNAATQFRDWEFLSPTSPAVIQPSYIWIGPYMKYYGYVDSMAVTYTHWSHRMVPIRCRIDIGFTLLMDPALTSSLSSSNVKINGIPHIGGIGATPNISPGPTANQDHTQTYPVGVGPG